MIEIVLTACTLVGQCQTVKLPIGPDVPATPYTCGFTGQAAAAEWCLRNPGYAPVRLRCGKPTENI